MELDAHLKAQTHKRSEAREDFIAAGEAMLRYLKLGEESKVIAISSEPLVEEDERFRLTNSFPWITAIVEAGDACLQLVGGNADLRGELRRRLALREPVRIRIAA